MNDTTFASVTIDTRQVDRIKQALGAVARHVSREIATAINATAKKVRFEASKALQKELKCPVAILKKAVKMKSRATADTLVANIRLWNGFPIPLKYFGAKKMKRGGVTFRIQPKTKQKGRMILRNAFIVEQYGGNVYVRETEKRYPIKQIYGPSPGDAFAAAGIGALVTKVASDELPKQMERRIRFLLLKQAGGLRGNQRN